MPSPASSTSATIKQPLKIMVVGSGGREHALVKAARRSPLVAAVIAAPGNGGIAAEVPAFPVKADDLPGLVALAQREKVTFVIVGPEVPLCLGLVNHLAAAGIPAFGPNAAAAILEGSKAFTKTFLLRHKIPTAHGEIFDSVEAAVAYLAKKSAPIVVKASGLAAGKGVTVAQTRAEAEAAVRAAIEDRLFADAGDEVLIEDFMPGEEASIILFVSGQNYLLLPASQDHKRINDGDTGPNTGGMGAYAPAAVVTPALLQQIETDIIRPTLAGLVADGLDYRGILYIGLMLTPSGPQVVEFNVRYGDPECQVLLPLLQTDPIQLMWDTAHGQLAPSSLQPQTENRKPQTSSSPLSAPSRPDHRVETETSPHHASSLTIETETSSPQLETRNPQPETSNPQSSFPQPPNPNRKPEKSSPPSPSVPSIPSVPSSLFAVAIVLSAANYPATPRLGDPITLPVNLPPNVEILHAGTTRQPDGTLVTSGGRVLSVTATAPTLRAAVADAYAICAQIKFPGAHYRRDIAARQLSREPN